MTDLVVPPTWPHSVMVDPRTDPRWAHLATSKAASLFVSPPWLRSIAETYGFRMEALVRDLGSEASTAGLVFCRLDDVMGQRIVSTPFCDFCDPVASDASEWAALLHPLITAGLPLQLRVTDTSWIDGQNLSVRSHDLRHEVSLVMSPEELWSHLAPGARQNINRSRRSGVTVRFDTTGAGIDAFFAMHSVTRRAKHGLLAQPHRFFRAIHREFSTTEGVAVALAEHEGRPVAGILLLEWNGRAYYKFNASVPGALSVRPNDLLMWESVIRSQGRGNELLDLGVSSSRQEGLVRYKRKFATFEGAVWTLGAGAARTPQQVELGPVLELLTALLVDDRVPLDVGERAADVLYRYFT